MTTPDPDPRRTIDRLIAELARSGRPFSANDIRPHLDRATAARNLITPRLQAAERTGLIEQIGTTRTDHPGGHARIIALYRGAGVPAKLPHSPSLRRKAVRLLTEGRVTILRVVDGDVDAVVRSDAQAHQVTGRPGSWHCGCNPTAETCSHVYVLAWLTGGLS